MSSDYGPGHYNPKFPFPPFPGSDSFKSCYDATTLSLKLSTAKCLTEVGHSVEFKSMQTMRTKFGVEQFGIDDGAQQKTQGLQNNINTLAYRSDD